MDMTQKTIVETVLWQWADELIVLAAVVYSSDMRLSDATSLSMWEVPAESTWRAKTCSLY